MLYPAELRAQRLMRQIGAAWVHSRGSAAFAGEHHTRKEPPASSLSPGVRRKIDQASRIGGSELPERRAVINR